jgi:hypothetical protein
VSPVDIIDQVCELITRDCLLVMFKNIPLRLVPKDANVLRGLETYYKDRCKEACGSSNDAPSPCYGVPGESLRRAESVNV